MILPDHSSLSEPGDKHLIDVTAMSVDSFSSTRDSNKLGQKNMIPPTIFDFHHVFLVSHKCFKTINIITTKHSILVYIWPKMLASLVRYSKFQDYENGNTTEKNQNYLLLSHQSLQMGFAQTVTTPETHGTIEGAFGWLFLYVSEYLSLKFCFGFSACNLHRHDLYQTSFQSNLDEQSQGN